MQVVEILRRDLQRLAPAERAPVARHHVLHGVALERVRQCCERGTVGGRRDVHERKLDHREVVADAQQLELAHAVARAALRVARQRHRLHRERPHLKRLAGLEDQVGARRALPAQALGGPLAHDRLGGLAARDACGGAAAHDRRHAREGRDPADVIPVRVRDQQPAQLEAARGDVGGDRRDLGRRDAGIHEHRLAAGVQGQRRRLPERALVADHAWAQLDRRSRIAE